jgi:C4-dicarboxylate-specific signal transduction histidine kinase
MQFNQQLLVTYECVSAIGTSLDLEEMLNHFLKIFIRKSGAIAAGFWVLENDEYRLVCGQGKRGMFDMIEPDEGEQLWHIVQGPAGEKVMYMPVGKGVVSFIFMLDDVQIKIIESILQSLYTKLDNAINACMNHERLLMLNTKLQEQVQLEVEKNRQKDKHILQQSRLAQMGEMISMIAHQWRQPLGSISTVAASVRVKLALKKFDLSTQDGREGMEKYLIESVNKIEEYVKFLTTTIDDFRNFFKPEKREESVALAMLIDRTYLVVGKALEVNGITLERDERSKRHLILYSNETMQVILNLLKNAEDAIKERNPKIKKIWIRTYDRQDESILEVEDSAGGIDEKIMEKIFDPYFSTKEEKNGTGLGLYMCKTIIQDHMNGRLSVENTGNGALFKLYFKGKSG